MEWKVVLKRSIQKVEFQGPFHPYLLRLLAYLRSVCILVLASLYTCLGE